MAIQPNLSKQEPIGHFNYFKIRHLGWCVKFRNGEWNGLLAFDSSSTLFPWTLTTRHKSITPHMICWMDNGRLEDTDWDKMYGIVAVAPVCEVRSTDHVA